MDSNISSTLTGCRRTQLWINSNVAGSKILQDIMQAPLRKLSSSVIEGQGYSHPMEGDSRSLRQLHDSAATAQKISNYLCSVRLHNINYGTQANFVINSLNKHACTMKHLPNPTRANKDSVLQAAVSGTQIFPSSHATQHCHQGRWSQIHLHLRGICCVATRSSRGS
jgi:hypothetical protein